jgi:ribosomal protein L11 methylase PrmA
MDLRREPPPGSGTVAANLLRPLLLELAERWESPPDRLIASGLLRGETDEVGEAFACRDLVERRRLEAGDWAALLLTRDYGESPSSSETVTGS